VETGTDWWARIIWNATEHLRLKLPAQPLRKMRHHSLLSGLAVETFAFEALAVEAQTEVGLDKKPSSYKWCQVTERKIRH
jgi:hypothetical protein